MTKEELEAAISAKRNWREGDNTLNATPDHLGELDEIFIPAERVHIERMDDTAFWIGIDMPSGEMVHVRTGVSSGTWYFSVEHDATSGSYYAVQRPRRAKRPKGTR